MVAGRIIRGRIQRIIVAQDHSFSISLRNYLNLFVRRLIIAITEDLQYTKTCILLSIPI